MVRRRGNQQVSVLKDFFHLTISISNSIHLKTWKNEINIRMSFKMIGALQEKLEQNT